MYKNIGQTFFILEQPSPARFLVRAVIAFILRLSWLWGLIRFGAIVQQCGAGRVCDAAWSSR